MQLRLALLGSRRPARILQRPEAVRVGGLFADLRAPLMFIISNPDNLRPQQPAKRTSSSSSSSSSSVER